MLTSTAANRSLEDLDLYYRENPSLIVTRDQDAISAKRPFKYIRQEQEEVEKAAARATNTVEFVDDHKAEAIHRESGTLA